MPAELEQVPPPVSPVARRVTVTGRRKAAVLLVSLGTEKAAEIFRHLREDEIESLSLEMAKLQRIDTLSRVPSRGGYFVGKIVRGARGGVRSDFIFLSISRKSLESHCTRPPLSS